MPLDLPLVLPPATWPLMREFWVRIRTGYWRGLGGQLEANLLLGTMLLELLRPALGKVGGTAAIVSPANVPQESDPIIRAIRFAHNAESKGHRVTCADLARAAGLSVARFRHRFGQQQGLAPQAWLAAQRLAAAAHSLDNNSGKDIAAVGRRHGWASASAFTRAFHRRYGMTPSAWIARRDLPRQQ